MKAHRAFGSLALAALAWTAPGCAEKATEVACQPGYQLCGAECVRIGNDPQNCGACGNACSAGQICAAGACQQDCASSLLAALPDPWGATWDGLERPTATLAAAEAACQGIGGRLPTATELYRVSAVYSGAVGQTYQTHWLWSLVPYNPANQWLVRLDTGATTTTGTGTTQNYRCVCPPTKPAGFSGTACFGPPGGACFTVPGPRPLYNLDKADRPPLSKGGAMWECGFEGGALADYLTLAESILLGLPGGSTEWLHTSDDVRYPWDAIVRWSGTQLDWTPAPNTTVSNTASSQRFRCQGLASPRGTHPNAVADEWAPPGGNGNKGESVDTAATAANFAVAHDTCNTRGGHLARATELGALVQKGLPGGSGAWLWSADQEGFNGAGWLTGLVRWTGVEPLYGHIYSDDITWTYKTDSQAYRCIYYPLDTGYAGPAQSDCQGGCFKLELPGTTPASLWFDAQDRAATTLPDAVRSCASLGGHLGSTRDLIEGIRHGLANGSGLDLFTSDLAYGEYGLNVMLVNWNGQLTGFTHTAGPWGGLGSSNKYRCVWTNELR